MMVAYISKPSGVPRVNKVKTFLRCHVNTDEAIVDMGHGFYMPTKVRVSKDQYPRALVALLLLGAEKHEGRKYIHAILPGQSAFVRMQQRYILQQTKQGGRLYLGNLESFLRDHMK